MGHWVEDEYPPDLLSDTRLPMSWDGRSLMWGEWLPPITEFLCAHNQLKRTVLCPGCRHAWLPFMNRGHSADWRLTVDIWRCGFCGYTTATSRDDGHGVLEWVLSESDYGLEGSYECK